MNIRLWPDLVEWPIEAYVSGDVITINGEDIDLSGVSDGFKLPGSAVRNRFFVETEYVERKGGVLNLTLRLPVDWDSPEEYLNPLEPMMISVSAGPVPFPNTSPPEPSIARETEE